MCPTCGLIDRLTKRVNNSRELAEMDSIHSRPQSPFTFTFAFHVVVLKTREKKWTQMKHVRAGRAKLLFLST